MQVLGKFFFQQQGYRIALFGVEIFQPINDKPKMNT